MKKIKVLMLGWEYPPYAAGGLGTHCEGITKPLSKIVDLTFVVPFKFKIKKPKFMKIIEFEILKPTIYTKTDRCVGLYTKHQTKDYKDYINEVKNIKSDFDIIHAQDWMTSFAGLVLKKISGKKLVITIHSTAYDVAKDPKKTKKFRYNTEKMISKKADMIIAVSNHTKERLINHYKVKSSKVKVIFNAVENKNKRMIKRKINRTVLYLGRLSYQKGIGYFLDAAKKVIEKDKRVRFVIVGEGRGKKRYIRKVKRMKIEDNVTFLGYVKDKDKTYRNADVFVMPSISEPFGITPLESMSNGTPVIISRQSGVSEVLNNCIKFNYWDTQDLAKKILKVLNDEKLYHSLRKNGFDEINRFSWKNVAKETEKLYREVI